MTSIDSDVATDADVGIDAGVGIDADVAIVGYGPVGQALALQLGRAGHRVVVVERFDQPYRLPRAVHIDHEIMRLLQRLGVADELAPEMLPVHDYRWFGADGDPLLTIRAPTPAASGWEPDYLFFQPMLEDTLDRAARAEPTVTIERGWTAERLDQDEQAARIMLRRTGDAHGGPSAEAAAVRTLTARWVIGADGANSFVREAAGIACRDLGFEERWFVVDIEPHDLDALAGLPPACQWCDPRRPTTHMRSGPSHHRWEFMLLPGERAADFDGADRAWALLEPWCSREEAVLSRGTVYEFRSMLAEQMRCGRVLLIGDAAHLTPPFMGQGLCAGLRDAANVAWKLDLALRGLAPSALLDTVDAERQPQNEWVIRLAIDLGRVLCELDPKAAAERDTAMRAAGDPPPFDFAPLTGGLLHRNGDGSPGGLSGTLGVQGRVAGPAGEGLFDDIVGAGFALIAESGDPLAGLSDRDRSLLEALECRPASLDPAAPSGVRDLDGRLGSWLSGHGAHTVLVRPDLYVFGSAATPAELPALIDDLRTQLGAHHHLTTA